MIVKTTTDLKIEQIPIDALRLDPAIPRPIAEPELEAFTLIHRSRRRTGEATS
jgi:nucleotidyltransferase/DNA polymerase involved in DNA repair